MPTLAGWLTGEQVPSEVIEQTLQTMGNVLGQHGGQMARTIYPGAGLITFPDQAYAAPRSTEPPVLDWVPDRRTMVYRRPLSGAHILYYIENWPAQGNLLFASEIKALLAVGVPRRLHLPALDALLRYGFIPAPLTAFDQIRVVPAGSILRWQRAQTVVNHATDYQMDKSLSSAEARDDLLPLLDEAVAELLPTHSELVALSGGDRGSALAITLTTRHTDTHFTVASIGYKKNETRDEYTRAEQIARKYDLPFLAITGVDQPEFWAATLAGLEAPVSESRALAWHQLLHTVAVETKARVAISGLGANALVDHPIQDIAPPQDTTSTRARLAWYAQSITAQPTRTPWSREVAQIIQHAEPWEESLHARKLARRASQLPDVWQQWRYLDLHLRLPDALACTVQQLALPERVAVRSPYLHHEVMNMLSRLPATLDDGTPGASIISILAQKELAGYTPFSSPLVAPTASLLQVADSELLQQTLSPEAQRATGIFDPEVVQELLTQGRQASRELLLVFTTQLFCRLFDIRDLLT